MIKEILLSLAVAAFSGVSSFVGNPKKASNNLPNLYFICSFHSSTYSVYGAETLDNTNQDFDLGATDTATLTFNGWGSLDVTFDGEENGNDSYIDLIFSQISYRPVVEVDETYWNVSVTFDTDGQYWTALLEATGRAAYDFWTNAEDADLEAHISFSEYIEPEYTITKQLYNCSINSMPELPNTYQSGAVGQTFVVYGAANSDLAGDYGFTSSSLSVTGATASAISLTNEIGNSGYYRGCSFSVTLPANSFTISLSASRPSFSIVSTLNNCTVSPSIDSTFSGIYVDDFTFTAANGYAFNSLVTSWEFSANITAQEPVFSNRLYGSLYEKVTFRLVFENGNCELRMTAVSFNLDSYAEGYDNGYTNGYDRGHADGVIAGDSYGVWNWLKQAARTTGEFLSIPLLPGFSIGGLLTALAGLVIIWFFIKGFLFKS